MISLWFLIFMLMLVLILVIVTLMLDWNMKVNKSKLSPFECGFESKIYFRSPLSIRFFILVVIFLIFDIEISLLMPIPFLFKWNFFNSYALIILVTSIILFMGVIHEWHEKSLDWVN